MNGDHDTGTKRRSWSAFMPRPASSGGRPGSSGSGTERPGSGNAATMTMNRRAFYKRPGSGSGLKLKDVVAPSLASPPEGKEMPPPQSAASVEVNSPPATADGPGFPRAITLDSDLQPFPSSRPKNARRWSSGHILTTSSKISSPKISSPLPLGPQASSALFSNPLERTSSPQPLQPSARSPDSTATSPKNGGAFGISFSSMMGGLSSLSLSRTSTRDSNDDKDRGRSMLKMKRISSSSQAASDRDLEPPSRSASGARSQSPFSFRRFRQRDSSPTPQAIPLSHSDAELSDTASVVPRSSAYTTDDESGDDNGGTDADSDDGSFSEEDQFDPITERNTERNAIIPPVDGAAAAAAVEIEDPDPVGEGVNIVVAPEPYFPTSLNSTTRGKRGPRKRKNTKIHVEPLPFSTSRPIFQRDRCTINLTQGEPEAKLGERRKRRYVIASDLSEESRYAVEWGIGTVLRDGDEMLVMTVVENEAKVDPAIANASDRSTKLRSQQERQGLAYILVRQVTGLLQRTRLNVTISCQAWHAKNSRHMLLDIVDHVEPTMLIVGSRGLGQLNGILLGSTSHYLIQKCSVPVMVARRRLKRPPKRNAHLATHRTHVSLAEAGIDRVAAKVDEDVKVMRDEIQKDDDRRDGGPGSREASRFTEVNNEGEPEEADDDDDDEPVGVKVAG